ncbi:MAG: hypothetical protein KJO45_07755 [Sulfurovum sp.]|nr:hypothetical protein [Sulfurovum sp.]
MKTVIHGAEVSWINGNFCYMRIVIHCIVMTISTIIYYSNDSGVSNIERQ